MFGPEAFFQLARIAITPRDPFGDDLEHSSVMTFIRTGWETSNKILNVKYPDDETEESTPKEQSMAEVLMPVLGQVESAF